MAASVPGARRDPPVALRRRARVLAFQALYELDATGHQPDVVIGRRVEDEPDLPGAGREHVQRLVRGVREQQTEIDGLIREVAPAWPLEQMSSVDKSVLRLAIFELLHEDAVPDRVAINEAVELAKIFGHDTSPKFVNGVLGTVAAMRESRWKQTVATDVEDALPAGESPEGERT